METALSEITLILFTTLAPAGAIAYGLMALPLILNGAEMDQRMSQRLDNFLCLPVVVTMVGLVASATHLGNPANVLYVFTGFGRSPLSNEVVCGSVFLGAAGVFWLTSFSEKPPRTTLRRIVALAISLLGVVFMAAITRAYDANTILAWHTPFTPATLWLNAFASGPLLAILGFRLARFHQKDHHLGRRYLIAAIIAFAADVAACIWWGSTLPTLQNAVTTAAELAPGFSLAIAAFAVLGSAGLGCGLKATRWHGEAPLWLHVASTALMLAGIFIMRFQFYLIHLTAGVTVGV